MVLVFFIKKGTFPDCATRAKINGFDKFSKKPKGFWQVFNDS